MLEVVASAVAAGEAGGVDGAVVGERGGRVAVISGGPSEGGDHDRCGGRAWAETCKAKREWSSSQLMTCASAPVASR